MFQNSLPFNIAPDEMDSPISRHLNIADVKRATWLIDTLPENRAGLFNPWKDTCQHDVNGNGPTARLNRLACHLACSPKLILVGEAPGYQGCRYSGVAFTSERLLLEGMIPRMPALRSRLTDRNTPFSEPSATIGWNTLYRVGLHESTVLWNALQMHPYPTESIWKNRTPTREELLLGKVCLARLIAEFPDARIVAVGNKAKDLMTDYMGILPAATVRHPANGGASKFSNELSAFCEQQSISTGYARNSN